MAANVVLPPLGEITAIPQIQGQKKRWKKEKRKKQRDGRDGRKQPPEKFLFTALAVAEFLQDKLAEDELAEQSTHHILYINCEAEMSQSVGVSGRPASTSHA